MPGATGSSAIARIRVVAIFGSASGWHFLGAPFLVSRVEQGSFAPAFNPAAIVLMVVLCGVGASWKAAGTAPHSLPHASLVVVAATYLMPRLSLIRPHAQSVQGAQHPARPAALSVRGAVGGVLPCSAWGEATGGAVPNPSLQRTRFARR